MYLGCVLTFRTIALMAIFSQYLRNTDVPYAKVSYKKKSGFSFSKSRFPLFKLFPVGCFITDDF